LISSFIANRALTGNYDDVVEVMLDDLETGLKNMSMDEITALYGDKTTYYVFGRIKKTLEKHGCPANFDAARSAALMLPEHDDYESFDEALGIYSFKEIEEIISKMTLAGMVDVHNGLVNKGYKLDFNEEVRFAMHSSSYTSSYHIGLAIDKFGIDGARKIISKEVILSDALEIDKIMNGDTSGVSANELAGLLSAEGKAGGETAKAKIKEEIARIGTQLKPGGLDMIIALARPGIGIVSAVEAARNGFSPQELIRFPFLISPLAKGK